MRPSEWRHMLQEAKRLFKFLKGLVFYYNPIESADVARWRQQDLDRLKDSPGLYANNVGKLIGGGFQHRIYEYRDDGQAAVLKLLVPNRFLRYPTLHEAQEDIRLVSLFMEPYAIEPARAVPLRDGSFAILQRHLRSFRPISPDDVKKESVLRPLLDIVARNQRMLNEGGRSLDFLGREGQRKGRAALLGLGQTPIIANLVLESDGNGGETIRVLDTDLENFRPGARNLRDLRSALAARIAYAVTRFLMRRYFGVDIAGHAREHQTR